MSSNKKQQLIKALNKEKDDITKDAEQDGYTVLTPDIGYRFTYLGTIYEIIKPTLRYNNKHSYTHTNAKVIDYDTSHLSLLKEAEKNWKPIFTIGLDDYSVLIHDGQSYEIIHNIFLYREADKPHNNGYLEDITLQDVTSPQTFDTFKDLYSFSKL